jgi:hypothetical protein
VLIYACVDFLFPLSQLTLHVRVHDVVQIDLYSHSDPFKICTNQHLITTTVNKGWGTPQRYILGTGGILAGKCEDFAEKIGCLVVYKFPDSSQHVPPQ